MKRNAPPEACTCQVGVGHEGLYWRCCRCDNLVAITSGRRCSNCRHLQGPAGEGASDAR